MTEINTPSRRHGPGFSEPEPARIAEPINGYENSMLILAEKYLQNMATKAELEELRGTTKTEFAAIRGEMKELRGEMETGFAQIRAENAEFREEIKDEVAKIRNEVTELRGEITELRGEMLGEVGKLRGEIGEIRGKIGELRGEMKALRQEMRAHTYKTIGALIATIILSAGGIIAAVKYLI